MSYADLVTLLLACFTTAYAASLAPPAVTEAAAPTSPPAAVAVPVDPAPVDPAAEREQPPSPPADTIPAPSGPSLRERLEPALAGGLDDLEIEIIEDARGLVISLPESATFPNGRADLTGPAQSLLKRIADAVRSTKATLRIEGHTDDSPIRGGRYTSNWELSTARASAVVVFMVTETAFEPSRLSAAGYGEFHPRAANDAPEGRALNRRVDVVVIDGETQPDAAEGTTTR
jgi:chemotaxis protein MotB